MTRKGTTHFLKKKAVLIGRHGTRERERRGAGRGTVEPNGKSELSYVMQLMFEERQWREAEQLEEWRRWKEERRV